MRIFAIFAFAITSVACQGEEAAAKRAAQRLQRAQAQKAEKKKRTADLDAQRQKARQGEPRLGAPWDDAKILLPDGPCPVGAWAFLPGVPPGPDTGDKRDTEASRASWVSELKDEVFMVKLRGPETIA